MSTNVTETGFTQEAFQAFLAERREPDWLRRHRLAAWQAFGELPIPRGGEEWRRTDLRAFPWDRYDISRVPPPGAPLPEALLSGNLALAGRAITLDGMPLHEELDPELARQGVMFGSLEDRLLQHGDLLRPHLLGRVVDPHHDRFAALHAAFWQGGTLVYVPRGVALDRPLHALSALSPGGVDLGHTLIVLEEEAQATVLMETASSQAGADGLHCGAIEILLAPGAHLRYVNLQNWADGVWHFAHQKALVDRDASLQWTIGALGARLAKVNQQVALTGEGAHAQVNGVMFAEGRRHLAYHTLQHHETPGGHSDLLYKGALQDRSHLLWRGMIKVDPDAQKTDAYQRNDNLMLSDHARADSIPGLEIEADDVKCSHGATIGRVDDEQVFYAQTRGLTRKEAVRMIVSGFFRQVFDRITIEPVREALARAISQRVRDYRET